MTGLAGNQTIGSGPLPPGLRALAVSPDASALRLMNNTGTVLRVDPVSVDRTVLSDATMGTGPTIQYPRDLVHDPDHARLLATTDEGYLIGIDLVTGDRTEVSGMNVGTGPLCIGRATVRPDGVYVTNAYTLTRIDLDTGDRTRLLDGGVGPGSSVIGAGLEPNGLLWTTDLKLGAALVSDPFSGERVIVSR